MKSRANIKSHPIHPLLVVFPIAFFMGTWLLDVIGIFSDNMYISVVAYYLNIGGIGFALLAAVPGLIDYTHTVPPDSSAKKRAAKHGLLNVTVVILFAVAFYLRSSGDLRYNNDFLITGIETIGVVLLSMAGWLGGTLVYRNQIGVDIRYAHAGKWDEEYLGQKDGRVDLENIHHLKVDQMKLVHVDNRRIVVARSEQGFVAFDDRCTHRGASLAGGAMMCGTVQCPWHGSQFDVSSGAVKAGPAREPIKTYPVIEHNGRHFIQL